MSVSTAAGNAIKEFFFTDLSGRGTANALDYSHIFECWDLLENDNEGTTLDDFLQDAEIGEKWETNDSQLIRTK